MTDNSEISDKVYGVSKDLVRAVSAALEHENSVEVARLIDPLHPADMADLIEALSSTYQRELINLLRGKLDSEVLAELDDYIRDRVLDQFTSQEVAAVIADLESDDAADLMADLSDEQQYEIFQSIPEDERVTLEQALRYPENSAGRLMQSEYVEASQEWTVGQALSFLETAQDLPVRFFDLFLVNERHQPTGIIALSQLIRYPKQTLLSSIEEVDHQIIPVLTDKEDIAFIFKQYGLTSVPVVDDQKKLVGMITVDDAMTIMQEETTEDFMRLNRVSYDDFYASVWQVSLNRFRWLFVTFMNTLIASSVLYQFQSTIERYVALAVLMPIVASMGGNAGMQVVAVIIRAISDRELQLNSIPKILGRELSVSFLNSIVFALFLSTISAFWFHDFRLGLVLGAAMIFNIVWSGIAGTILPIALHRAGMDPAISSGPILTTTTDVFGFSVFLGLATLFLL